MENEIRIYYEGHRLLKSGFDVFFQELHKRARAKRWRIRLIAAKSGDAACGDFAIAQRTHPNQWNILLKDSEGPDTGKLSAVLCTQKGWSESYAGSIFWMVQMMESWFHADPDALEKYYGEGFNRSALRPNRNVEQIPKQDLEDGLKRATKDTKKRGYHKTAHGPDLLARIKPELVREAASNCDKLFDAVLAKLA